MNLNNPYGIRGNGNGHGDVFTSPCVVKFMLDMLGYTPDKDLSKIKILEPACGEGEFLIEIAERIKESAKRFGFDSERTFFDCVYGFELDESKVSVCKSRLESVGINAAHSHIEVGDFLLSPAPQVDMVVGNPPYVRYENIPEPQRIVYKNQFPTFHYRADLYVLFFEKTLKLLVPGGKHCFLCSNRWLKNEYGKKLRRFVSFHFQLDNILNLEQADAFQEDVLAYPAITLISNRPPKNTFYYAEIKRITDFYTLEWIGKTMPKGDDWSDTFNTVAGDKTLFAIEELGFKVGIGVATGADAVFVSKRLPELVEQELLLPALNARNLRGDKMQWNGEYLLNPFDLNGNLINLSCYPKAKQYLLSYKSQLSSRHVAKKNASKWYKTIDHIVPKLRSMPKILLPDMSGNRYVFIDEGLYYPLHNLYYIIGDSVGRLKLLSAVLMSETVRRQICSIANNMNGGFPRWQSQYLRKLRVPDIYALDKDFEAQLIQSYDNRDYEAINDLVYKMYEDQLLKNHKPIRRTHSQLELEFAV